MDIHCSNINRHWQNKLCYFRNCTEKPNMYVHLKKVRTQYCLTLKSQGSHICRRKSC
ncbi:hypothetical protein Plhal304r1_c028g0092051 [Plasmopara halstedii]